MSNKTSDKNVANIEEDVELVKRYLENSAYKESNSDFFKNGGWEMVDLEIPKAMANILAEREQDKKRIKELEEENYVQKIQIYENSIPKQELKEKLEKIQSLYEKNLKELDLKEVEKIDRKIFEGIRLEAQRGLIKELLEGEK